MKTALTALCLSLLCAAGAPALAKPAPLKVRASCAEQPRCFTTIGAALEAAGFSADASGEPGPWTQRPGRYPYRYQ